MGTQSKNKSLEDAKRVYTCPLMFVAPEDSQTRLRKKTSHNNRSSAGGVNGSSNKLRSKRDKELQHKQHERLHQLLSIYADQTSQSFRIGASNIGSLPKLSTNYERKRTVIELGGRINNGILPKLLGMAGGGDNNQSTRNKRRSSKVSDVHFPSILE